MKLTIQIPKGWRRLRVGEKRVDSDREPHIFKRRWVKAYCPTRIVHEGELVIRRVAKRPRKKWRILKAGEVKPVGYQRRLKVKGACWEIGLRAGDIIDQDECCEFRAPVRGKGGK